MLYANYHFSTVIDFSSQKYSIAQWLEHWVYNPGVASSSLTIGMGEIYFPADHEEMTINPLVIN